MNKKVKKLLSLLCVLTLTLSMTACGKADTSKSETVETTDNAQTGDATIEEKTEPAEDVEITMLDFFIPGDGVTEAFRPLYDKFLEEHPNITIDEESISNADTATKVQTLAAADELPDVFVLKGQMAQSFVDNGKVYALDDMLNSDEAWKSNFKDGVFSNFSINNKVYGVPFQVTNTCVFYNKELFAQAGITEFPATWDDLLVAVDKLKAIGVVPIALGNKEKWNAESVILSTLANRYTGTDWYQSIRDKSGAKFTDPDFVSALTALSDLAKAGAFNTDVNSIDGAQQRQMYMNGKAAMTIDGTWAVSDFDGNCPDEVKNVTEIAALPSVTGGKGDATAITGGAGWAYAVNANIAPEKLEAVKELIIALTGPEYATLAIQAGTLTAANPGEYQQDTSKVIATKFDTFANGRPFIPVYDHQINSSIIEVMNSGLQELLIDAVSPEELAERIQAEYERN